MCVAPFCQGRLLDGVSAADRPPLLVPLEGSAAVPLSPFVFVNIAGGVEERGSSFNADSQESSGSFYNLAEVDAITQIVRALLIHGIAPSQIGVIAPYRAQASRILQSTSSILVTTTAPPMRPKQAAKSTSKNVSSRTHQPTSKEAFAHSVLKRTLPASIAHAPADENESDQQQVSGAGVQVSTVDAFQGAEKVRHCTNGANGNYELITRHTLTLSSRRAASLSVVPQDVILLSCVRSGDSTSFLDNANRLNVSLTRARHHLILVGRRATLETSTTFKSLLRLSHSKPMAFAPNIAEFIKQINKLTCREEKTDGDATNEHDHHAASHPTAFSVRDLAREYQENPSTSRHAGTAHHDPAGDDDDAPMPDDDDFESDEDDEEEKAASRPRVKRRRSELDTTGMSPYAVRAALQECIDDDDDDEEYTSSSSPAPAVSIHTVLHADIEKRTALRRASEARVPVVATVEETEEDERHFSPVRREATHMTDEDMAIDHVLVREDAMRAAGLPVDDDAKSSAPHSSLSSSPFPTLDLDDEFDASSSFAMPRATHAGRRDDVQVRTKRRKTIADADE